MRPITEKQFRLLLILGSASMVLVPGRRDWGPHLRRGFVTATGPDDGGQFLPPLRITPAGLRALADGVERFGLPPLGPQPEEST